MKTTKLNHNNLIMKLPLIIFLVFIFTFQHTQAQVMETSTDVSPQKNYDFYTLKKKNNETAAWILLGAGTALVAGGYAVVNSTNNSKSLGEGMVRATGGGLMIIGGGGAVITSIPLFISAGKNKRKAILSLKGEPLTFRNLSYKKSQYMSIALTIDF